MSKKSPMYIVFVSSELIPHLHALHLFHVNTINGSHFLTCNKIKDDSSYFLTLIVDKDLQDHGVEYAYEIQIPYHAVLYIFSGPDAVRNKILGFRKNSESDDKKINLLSDS
jgi:hypothetical protein